MRLKSEQTVQIWQLNPETGEYLQVYEARQMLADQTRLYALDVVTGPFASPGLKVTQYADNTPKSTQIVSSNNTAGAIDAATATVSGVDTGRNADASACQSARAQVISANSALTSAQKAYDDLSATASAELRAAFARAIVDAKAAAEFARDNPQC
jgi:hypothetical protein